MWYKKYHPFIIVGVMAGMSRDKCGSAVVAGFLQCVANLKPKGIKVIGAMAMVSKQ
jgi:leucyl aminopeptidase